MTIYVWIPMILAALLAVAAYRLGLADGLSAARRGRLAGSKSEKQDQLLERINAYDGRKDTYESLK